MRDDGNEATVAGQQAGRYEREPRVFHTAVRKTRRQHQQIVSTPFVRTENLLGLLKHFLRVGELEDRCVKKFRFGVNPGRVAQRREEYIAGGYSAGYYAYLWSEILDADGFAAFKQAEDIFDPATAARLKKWVYQAGGLREADELYRSFRGQDPSIEPLLEGRGFAVKEAGGDT